VLSGLIDYGRGTDWSAFPTLYRFCESLYAKGGAAAYRLFLGLPVWTGAASAAAAGGEPAFNDDNVEEDAPLGRQFGASDFNLLGPSVSSLDRHKLEADVQGGPSLDLLRAFRVAAVAPADEDRAVLYVSPQARVAFVSLAQDGTPLNVGGRIHAGTIIGMLPPITAHEALRLSNLRPAEQSVAFKALKFVTGVNEFVVVTLDDSLRMPVGRIYTGKTGENGDKVLLDTTHMVESIECCSECDAECAGGGIDCAEEASKVECVSHCTACHAAQAVCAVCLSMGFVDWHHARRACFRCVEQKRMCRRMLVVVTAMDGAPSNEAAAVALDAGVYFVRCQSSCCCCSCCCCCCCCCCCRCCSCCCCCSATSLPILPHAAPLPLVQTLQTMASALCWRSATRRTWPRTCGGPLQIGSCGSAAFPSACRSCALFDTAETARPVCDSAMPSDFWRWRTVTVCRPTTWWPSVASPWRMQCVRRAPASSLSCPTS
jgi:hypothetical protein